MNRNMFANFERAKNAEVLTDVMDKINILWVDDEIDLLQPHLLFLREKGYDVISATNGHDALEQIKKNQVDIVFLDENMPGMSGLETLSQIKTIHADLPVVMITK